MQRPQRVVSCAAVCLVFLVRCAATCLASGQGHGPSLLFAAMQPHSEHGRCHPAHATPRKAPASCGDCGGLVCLAPVPPERAPRAALGPALSPLCRLPSLRVPSVAELSVSIAARAGNTPRSCTHALVVLRL